MTNRVHGKIGHILLFLLLFVCLVGMMVVGGCTGNSEPDPSEDDENGEDPADNGDDEEPADNGDDEEPAESPPSGRGNRIGHFDALVLEADGWFYYSHFPYEEVAKARIDGTDSGIVSADIGAVSFNQVGDWIVYVCDAGLVRIRPDGTDREVLFASPDSYLLRYLSYVDGFYFLAQIQEGQPDQGILRIPFGDTEPLRISSDAPAGGMCVAGGYVYYSTGVDGVLYRMGIDGSSRVALADGFHPIVEGDYLYYARENRIVQRNLNTAEERSLTLDLYGNSFQVLDENLYYTHAVDDLKLHAANWGGGTEVVVVEPVWKAFLYDSGIVFQHHDDWKIYRVPAGSTAGVMLP